MESLPVVQVAGPPSAVDSSAATAKPRPFADLRAMTEPLTLRTGALAFEVGAGLEIPHLRVSLHARVYPEFGVTARGGLMVPLREHLAGYVSLEVPVLFRGSVAVGLGAVGGVEYFTGPYVGLFAEVGARHFFLADGYEANRLIVEAGVRLRLP